MRSVDEVIQKTKRMSPFALRLLRYELNKVIATKIPPVPIKTTTVHRLRGKPRIVRNPNILGGEATFAGTRVSVLHVGLLVMRGVPLNELREDFPRLNDRHFEVARQFAENAPPEKPPGPLKIIFT